MSTITVGFAAIGFLLLLLIATIINFIDDKNRRDIFGMSLSMILIIVVLASLILTASSTYQTYRDRKNAICVIKTKNNNTYYAQWYTIYGNMIIFTTDKEQITTDVNNIYIIEEKKAVLD